MVYLLVFYKVAVYLTSIKTYRLDVYVTAPKRR